MNSRSFHPIIRKFFRLLAGALPPLAALATLHAADLRFVSADGADNDLKFMNQGAPVAITVNGDSLSPAYAFNDAGPLVLFKEIATHEKTVRVTVATLAVPSTLTHAIVVLTAADTALTHYSGLLIDDSSAARPAGTILLLNDSTYPLSFTLGAEKFLLAPGALRQIPPLHVTNRIVVQADAKVAGQWEPLFSNPLPLRSGLRALLLMRNGHPQLRSKTNLVDMLAFYDRPPEPPPAIPQ